MAANFERRFHDPSTFVWAGKYKKLRNLPHWHMECELIVCRGGHAELTLEGQEYTLTDGTAAFCPSGSVHRIHADDSATVIVAQADGELYRFLGENTALRQPVFPDSFGLYPRLEAILEELNDRPPYYAQHVNAVMTQLLIDLFRSQPTEVRNLSTTLAQYRQLLSEIDRDSEFITFSDAAQRMNMSPAYFSRYFHHAAGMPFSDYLNLIKIDKAIRILNDRPEIATSDLALLCGFNTLRSFNRVFRKITGCSPKQLPRGFTLHIRQYAENGEGFDPTLEGSVEL